MSGILKFALAAFALACSSATAAEPPHATPIAVAVPAEAVSETAQPADRQVLNPKLGELQGVTSVEAEGGPVRFSEASESAAALPLSGTADPSTRFLLSRDAQEVTNLGVAAEGAAITFGKTAGANMVTRFKLGPDLPFYFHRDAVYDAQAYMRAREIEKGAGSRQGDSTFVPTR